MPRAQVVALPAHTLMVVHPPARVRALSGTLWLTADGVGEDIVLEAGESRRFAEGGRVLAHALGGEALFEVCGATAARAGGPSGPVHRLLARLVRRLRRRPVPEAGA